MTGRGIGIGSRREEEGEGGGETEYKSDGGKEGDGVIRVRPVCQVHELPSSSRKISVQK